jgi:putative PEP-CTERM system histidine kinase
MSIVEISYASMAAAFALLSAVMLLRYKTLSIHPLLLLATVLTSAWGVIIMLSAPAPIIGNLLSAGETLKTAAWILFLSSLLFQFWRQANSLNYTFVLSMAMAFLFTLQIVIDLGALRLFDVNLDDAGIQDLIVQAYIFGRLVVAIAGLALIENLYRSTEKSEKWKLRPLGLAVGGMFAYDILLYAEGLLFTSIDSDLFAARGFVHVMAAPLIYVSISRIRRWTFDVVLSRRAVFHSLSLLVTGFYLIFMAMAGWALRHFGGSWGAVLQIAFICAAGGFLLYLFVSDGARARARVLLAKYFRRYKYDYRDTWIKFIRRIDEHDGKDSLQARVIDGVCEIIDSQGGRLYLKDQDNRFALAETRNFRSEFFEDEAGDSKFIQFLEETRWIVDLNEVRAGDIRYDGLQAPGWVDTESQAWLIIPLFRDQLVGYIVTRQPRAARRLDWEDHDLLKTIGMQAASYLAEQKSQAALSEAEQFDAFNRRFAFIMHDLKNLVSQLSLLSRNVERHGADPEFQKDMAETLESSVSKINMLLARLHQSPDKVQHLKYLDIRPIVETVLKQKKRAYDALMADLEEAALMATVDAEKLEQVLTHLTQNAIDASPDGKPITMSARQDGDHVRIEIADNGTGMSAEFVQKELFKPFASTKEAGFGIGAYEARELTVQMGGTLSVASELGEGTRFSLSFASKAETTNNDDPDA